MKVFTIILLTLTNTFIVKPSQYKIDLSTFKGQFDCMEKIFTTEEIIKAIQTMDEQDCEGDAEKLKSLIFLYDFELQERGDRKEIFE